VARDKRIESGHERLSRRIDAKRSKRDGKPLKARSDYLRDLLAERLTGHAMPHVVTPAMRDGIEREPLARAAYEIATGSILRLTGFVPHPTIEFFGASPDALVGADGLVEFKCPTVATHMEWMLAGVVPDPNDPSQWWSTSIGTVPIGQGIGVTPIQMAAAYGAIANEGVYRTPYLVRRVGNAPHRRSPARRVLSKTVSAQMMAMLRDVVSAEGGTGAAAAVPGYTVAGKTGTAAKPVPGGYSTSRYVASFVGVVPAKNPRLVVLVSIDEPRGAIWGGVVAAPAFSDIARSSLVELEIAPDATPDSAATR